MKNKSKKLKTTQLFEQTEEQIKKVPSKIQKKLDKKEIEIDKKFAKEFPKVLERMNLIEIDRTTSPQEEISKINKLLLEGSATWHHYSMGKHYYQINNRQL